MIDFDSKKMMAVRQWLNLILMFWSGMQIVSAFYYGYMIAGGMGVVWQYRLKNNYKIWLYGMESMFVDGIIYHGISKALYHGTSGFKMQYFAILLNLNQIAAAACFFKAMFEYTPTNGFVIFQVLVYIPVFILGVLMTILGWKSREQKVYTLKGSWLYYRRRDWGLIAVFVAACLFLLTFIKGFQDKMSKRPTGYSDYNTIYIDSMMIMWVGALGYHFLGLKVSKGNFKCHRYLCLICLAFTALEFIGLVMYVYSTNKAAQVGMLYYHIVIFSAVVIVAALGNCYISWRPFREDCKFYMKEFGESSALDSISEEDQEEQDGEEKEMEVESKSDSKTSE